MTRVAPEPGWIDDESWMRLARVSLRNAIAQQNPLVPGALKNHPTGSHASANELTDNRRRRGL